MKKNRRDPVTSGNRIEKVIKANKKNFKKGRVTTGKGWAGTNCDWGGGGSCSYKSLHNPLGGTDQNKKTRGRTTRGQTEKRGKDQGTSEPPPALKKRGGRVRKK